MSRGKRSAQTPFEQDEEFTVEKILNKKLMKVPVGGNQVQVKHGKRN